MRLDSFTALRPKTVKEALALKEVYKEKALLKAGGTALIPEIRLGLKKPECLIFLNGMEEMKGLVKKADGLSIGAATSLDDVKKSPLVAKGWAPLAEAVETVSAPSMHFQSTIGGNLCQDTRCIYYDQSEFWRGVKGACFKQGGDRCHAVPGSKICHSVYQGDLAPILVCMDASFHIATSRQEKIVKAAEFFSGNGLAPFKLPVNAIMTRIIIPPMGKKKVACEKFSERGSLDYPVAGVAACVELKRGRVDNHCFVATSVGSAPLVVSEPLLNGRKFDEDFIAAATEAIFRKARPVANTIAAPAWRREMTKALLERALRRLMP
jgi:4-hydroxybenzoyl-CoA reductase subunit beta